KHGRDVEREGGCFGHIQVYIAPEIITFEIQIGIVSVHSGYIILTVLVVKTHGHIVTHGLAAAADVHVGIGEGSPVLVNAVYPVHVRIEVRIKAAGGFGDHFIRIHRGVVIIFAGFIVELHEGNAVQHFG